MRKRSKKSKAEVESRMLDVVAWIVVRLIFGIVGFVGTFLLMGRTWRFFADDSGPSRVLVVAGVVAALFMIGGPPILASLFDRSSQR